jgi:hypothetical protein
MAARTIRRSSAAGTRRLPRSAFAYPSRRAFPINTVGRARSALARSRMSSNRATYQHVARAVRRRYGNRVASVGPRRGTVTGPGYRSSAARRVPARRLRRASSGRFARRRR